MTYHAELAGFSGSFDSVAQLKAWAEKLNAQHSLKGFICKIYKATWVAKDGSCASYAGVPTHTVVVGA